MSATKTGKYRLGFIGAGKLAGSVIRGLVRAKFCPPGEIIASEPFAETREKLQRETGDLRDDRERRDRGESGNHSARCETGDGLQRCWRNRRAVGRQACHFARGRRGRSEHGGKANARFMRAMTNTPSAICRAVTAIARGDKDNRCGHENRAQHFRIHRCRRRSAGRSDRCCHRSGRERTGVRLSCD